MLEQSALHGRIYRSEVKGKTLVSKPVPLASISFGPMRPVRVYRITDWEVWVEDLSHGNWYHYQGHGDTMDLSLTGMQSKMPAGIENRPGNFYYYGKALCDAKHTGSKDGTAEHLYFVQNKPEVAYGEIPYVETIQVPLTMQALDYGMEFHYPNEIKQLLAKAPACYVDRYKRPIKRVHGRVYPIAMEKVTTTWGNLPETGYPVVVDFGKTPFAVADLEPDHTADDLKHFQSLPGFYEEETPRGGKHKVIRVESSIFKFRYSPGLEIINQSQATLYGIHAKWLSEVPDTIDISKYATVGHTEHHVNAVLERPDVSREVTALKLKAESNLSLTKEIAASLYRTDLDDSHGEYVALRTLFHGDIKPYMGQFRPGLLPWILESYASDVIDHREKHETMRNGLPYLVYLAAIIIGKEDKKVWEGQKCISSEPVR